MFSMLMLATVFVSCTKDTDTINNNDEQASSVYNNVERAQGFDYATANQRIQDDIAQNGLPSLPLSQAAIDHYLDIAEYDGSIDASSVSHLNDEVLIAQDLGLEKYLDQHLKVREFTTETILTIADKGPNPDVVNDPQFRELPKNERQMILGANDIADSFYKSGRMNRTNGPGDSLLGAVSFGIAGFAGGFGLCGPPCGIVGGVIGAVFGWFTGVDGQK